MKKLIMNLTILNLFLLSAIASAEEVLVVVSVDTPINQLSKSEVIDIFMGKYVAFPDGSKANKVELSDDSQLKEKFYKDLVGRSITSVNAYWSRLQFTGRQRSAIALDSEEQAAKYIAETPFTIGYVSSNYPLDNLKVVYRFNE